MDTFRLIPRSIPHNPNNGRNVCNMNRTGQETTANEGYLLVIGYQYYNEKECSRCYVKKENKNDNKVDTESF